MSSAADVHSTGKAARVLAAAEDLVLKHGFKGMTMAAVAQRAHVGKGTPYLYWRTKEELFLELITNNLAETLDDLAARVRTEPGLAVADRLVPTVADAWLARPLVRALQTSDVDVLGALIDDPRTLTIAAESGAAAVLNRLLPIWRAHHTVAAEWTSGELAGALEFVIVGYFATHARAFGAGAGVDRSTLLRLATAALLQTRPARDGDEACLAEEIGSVLSQHAEQLRQAR